MIRSVRMSVTPLADSEKVETAVTGQEGLTKRITELWVEMIADRIVRGYKGTDRIVDVHCDVEPLTYLAIPVDLVLAAGEEFKVGFLDESSASSAQEIVVFYEET